MNATRPLSPRPLKHQHARLCGHAPHALLAVQQQAQQALDRAMHRAMGFSTIHYKEDPNHGKS